MKYIYISLGIISAFLGILGIFIPLLPTTPFLLLSAFLFGKSSKRLYNLIINNKVLGKYIRDYSEKQGITLKNKVISISFLGAGILFSFIKMSNIYGRAFLLVVFLGVSYHIYSIKTLKN